MLLLFLIIIPFINGVLCWQSERVNVVMPKWIALITMIITSCICLLLIETHKDIISKVPELLHWQDIYFLTWITNMDFNIYFGLDGLSLVMIILTSFLGFLAVLCSWSEIKDHQGFFYFNLLWILGNMFGIFLSINMFLFFCFWEMMLVPIYFLIVIWGHKSSENRNNISIATKFFIYSQISGLIMLISILSLVVIHYNTTGFWTFNYEDLLYTPMSSEVQYLLMIGFFLAFAIKMPIVPLHGWLPDAHSQAPTAGSVDLAGILLKAAAYGLLRFNLPLFPQASQQFAPIAMFLGIINIFYGSWIACAQYDIKRLIAYTSISHMGYILIAIYSGNHLAYQGAILSMIAHGLSSSGMFIICGQLYERLKTRDIREMGGLWSNINLIPACALLFSVAMFGMPGTVNFIGEIIILIGNFLTNQLVAIIATFGLLFAFVYSFNMIQNIYYGNNKYYGTTITELTLREKNILILLVFLVVLLGFFPQIIIKISLPVMNNIEHWLLFAHPIYLIK